MTQAPEGEMDCILLCSDDEREGMASGELFGSEAEASCKRSCLVDGCTADLSGLGSRYCQSRRVCLEHIKASCVRRRGSKELWRFCQQCGKLELLSAFDGNKRSCRKQLARRRLIRGMSSSDRASAASASAPLIKTEVLEAALAPEAAPDAVAATVSATRAVNNQLEQHLALYQQQCTLLRMQIKLLEEQQAAQQAQSTAAAAAAGGITFTSMMPSRSDTPAALAAPASVMPPVAFDPSASFGACSQNSSSSVAPPQALAMLAAYAGSMPSASSASAGPIPSSLQLQGVSQGCSPTYLPAATAGIGMHQLPMSMHASNKLSPGQHGAPGASTLYAHDGMAACMGLLSPSSQLLVHVTGHSLSGHVSLEPTANCLTLQQQQQHAQLLPNVLPTWSAPLPSSYAAPSFPAASYSCVASGAPQMMGAAAAAVAPPQALLVMEAPDAAADSMECDSAETIEDILEMALLEAAVEAHQTSPKMGARVTSL